MSVYLSMHIQVAFFDDAQKTPTTARKEAPLLPRSNPRAYIFSLSEELNPTVNSNNTSFEKNSSPDTCKNGRCLVKLAWDYIWYIDLFIYSPSHIVETLIRNFNLKAYIVKNLMSNIKNKASNLGNNPTL